VSEIQSQSHNKLHMANLRKLIQGVVVRVLTTMTSPKYTNTTITMTWIMSITLTILMSIMGSSQIILLTQSMEGFRKYETSEWGLSHVVL
jgi:hypothetical protein